jgi:PAS domain S-box-containing protein
MIEGPAAAGPPEERGPFRWPALFQRADEPFFVLNRRRAIVFVNHAWEKLTGLSADKVRRLVCRRHGPASLDDSLRESLASLLRPPHEVLEGETTWVRRLLPGDGVPRWWDVEFTPLRRDGRLLALLGRIVPVPAVTVGAADSSASAPGHPPLPSRLATLRQQVQRRLNLFRPGEDLPALRRLAEQVRLASQVRVPVVLIGEPGTGKRTLARIIHARSPQNERAFAVLDCTRLPAWSVGALLLVDAGALQRRQLGAIYLHEPGRLPRDYQLHLWEQLVHAAEATSEEEQAWEAGLPRLLAGFASDPRQQIASGHLLPELFCALDTLRLELPPLRDRLAELPLLIERCLARLNSDGEKSVSGVTPEALEMLTRHFWPGNLAELLQVLDQARQHAASERITLDDLPLAVRLRQRLEDTPGRTPDRLPHLDQVLEQVERRLIVLALQRTKGHKAKACEMLGIWRPRLLRRMEALGIADPAPDTEE